MDKNYRARLFERRRMEEINMTGMTMSPIFGIFFALVGLALAVVLGLVLYKDKKQ